MPYTILGNAPQKQSAYRNGLARANAAIADGSLIINSRLVNESIQDAWGNESAIFDAFVIPASVLRKFQIDFPEIAAGPIPNGWQLSFELYSGLDANGDLSGPITTLAGETTLAFSILAKPSDNAMGGYAYSLDGNGTFDPGKIDFATITPATQLMVDGRNQLGALQVSIDAIATTAQYVVILMRAW